MKGHGDLARHRIVTKSLWPFGKRGTMFKMTRSFCRLLRIGALAAVLTLGVSDLAMAAGIRSASDYFLSTGPTYQMYGDRIHRYVSYTFSLVNGSSRAVLIRKVGQNGPGLQLLVPSGSGMTQKLIPPSGLGKTHTVLPHKSIRLTVWFYVSECAKVPKGSWPLAMDAAWRTSTWQRVGLQMQSAGSVQWQRSLTGFVCS
jgi:hypothetical protein